MAYKIAEYLPDDAKRAAVAEVYNHHTEILRFPANVDLCCPLGVALAVVRRSAAISWWSRPGPGLVTGALIGRHYTPEQWAALQRAAAEFISDWDSGRITDLADALGVAQ